MDVVLKTDRAVFNYRGAGIWINNEHVLLHKFVNDVFGHFQGAELQLPKNRKKVKCK
ncbi:hypothetical protein ACQKNC_21810 [Lysinibacillus sp. NPDC094177]|uniref:hypothetical protein n=1 Tax=Lysinibacillus sp. NPDC094177 TaxID=3390580 RepID=UPI003D06E011